jgi:molybdopterin molybdotransferase
MGDTPIAVLEFDAALEVVLKHAGEVGALAVETVALLAARGRVLAEVVRADRDQPPFDRSTRDGFAVIAEDFGVETELRVVGQVRAGERWQGGALENGCAIEIMTGAPMPEGADTVVMVEHVERVGDGIRLREGRAVWAGENVVSRGREARMGEAVLAAGTDLGAAEIALAAACGCSTLEVFRRPRVAIVATGDELVEVDQVPGEEQIRNSNSYGIAALVEEAGGQAVRMPMAPDRREELERIIREARKADLLVLSGGVSMGEYDLVEEVLLGLGAEFFFTGVRMQPGKPLVFGRLPAKDEFPALYFFGLPGNPVSTQVTFHCFVGPLLRAICGGGGAGPRFVQATLTEEATGKAGLMRILPARLTTNRVRPEVRLVGWQGSGDLAANARANCYAVLPPEVEGFAAGDVITVLIR